MRLSPKEIRERAYVFETFPKIPWRAQAPKRAPRGPWWGEPDVVVWATAQGHPGVLSRGVAGCWCGYVGLRAECAEVGDTTTLRVHGGINWERSHATAHSWFMLHEESADVVDAAIQRGLRAHRATGVAQSVVFLGFDCAHHGDFCPCAHASVGDAVYRDLPYAFSQVERLASQCTLGRVVLTGFAEVE